MRNWSFNKKILLVGLIFISTSLGVASLGVFGLARLDRSLELLNESFEIETILNSLEKGSEKIRSLEAEAILEPSFEQTESFPKKIAESYSEIERTMEVLAARSPKTSQNNRINELRVVISKRKELSDKILKAVLDGDVDLAVNLRNPEEPPAQPLDERLNKLVEEIIKTEQTAILGFKRETTNQGKTWVYWAFLFAAAAIGSGILLFQGVMAQFNKGLTRIIENLVDSANLVIGKSQQLTNSSLEMTDSSAIQSESLERTTMAVEKVVTFFSQTASASRKASDLAAHTVELAEKGKIISENMLVTMNDINQNNLEILVYLNHSNQQIDEVARVITEISNKTKIINDIVFQTKLLSFNASVEAARAGEHGKGFAVVADDIGNLYQVSSASAKDIQNLLQSCTHKVENVVRDLQTKMEKLFAMGREKLTCGTSSSVQSHSAMQDLMDCSGSLLRMTNELSAASNDPSLAIAELNRSLEQLESLNQQRKMTMEACFSSAEEIANQTDGMKKAIHNLVKTVKGQQSQMIRIRRNQDNETPAVESDDAEIPTPRPVNNFPPRTRAVKSMKPESKNERLKLTS